MNSVSELIGVLIALVCLVGLFALTDVVRWWLEDGRIRAEAEVPTDEELLEFHAELREMGDRF